MPIHLLQSYSKLPVTVINWRREDTCLWDDLDQDQLSKITCIMVRQMNQWVSRWIPQFFWCVMFWLISDTLILIRSSQWRHPECFLAFTKTRYMFFSQKLAERFFIAISHYRSIYLHGENLVIIIYLHYMYTYVKLIDLSRITLQWTNTKKWGRGSGGQFHTNHCILSTRASSWCLCSLECGKGLLHLYINISSCILWNSPKQKWAHIFPSTIL